MAIFEIPWLILKAYLSHYRWFRRLHGGHWEKWWCDVTCSELWLDLDFCTQEKCNRDAGIRPGACMGRPTCEDWARTRTK